MPRGVIPLDELPTYAGLIEVDEFIVVTRKAPRLHRQPIAERYTTYMLQGMAVRFWQHRYSQAMKS